MSVILVLAIPLVAAALVCIPFKKHWAAAVTVASCAAILILALQVALQVVAAKPSSPRSKRAC